MLAFKCDICKKFYEADNRKTNVIKIGTRQPGCPMDDFKYYEICPECFRKIRNVIMSKEENADE